MTGHYGKHCTFLKKLNIEWPTLLSNSLQVFIQKSWNQDLDRIMTYPGSSNFLLNTHYYLELFMNLSSCPSVHQLTTYLYPSFHINLFTQNTHFKYYCILSTRAIVRYTTVNNIDPLLPFYHTQTRWSNQLPHLILTLIT